MHLTWVRSATSVSPYPRLGDHRMNARLFYKMRKAAEAEEGLRMVPHCHPQQEQQIIIKTNIFLSKNIQVIFILPWVITHLPLRVWLL